MFDNIFYNIGLDTVSKYVILPKLCKSKKCVKNNTLYINKYKFLIISRLNNEPGVSPMTHQFDSYYSGMTHFI